MNNPFPKNILTLKRAPRALKTAKADRPGGAKNANLGRRAGLPNDEPNHGANTK